MTRLTLICVIMQAMSLVTCFEHGSHVMLKFKIPLHEYRTYEQLTLEFNHLIEEVIKPFDNGLSRLENGATHVYEDWIVGVRSETNSLTLERLIDRLVAANGKIEFKLVNWKRRSTMIRRRRSEYYHFSSSFNRIHHDRKIDSQNMLCHYYSVDQIYEWLHSMNKLYPNITELVEIGRSFQNRSLLVLKLGFPSTSNSTKKLFWFDSGIHAREWTTISTSMFTIKKLLEEQKRDSSSAQKLLKNFDLYFLVMANPDGYNFSLSGDFTYFWRKNMRGFKNNTNFETDCFGVDLNRNFNYHWLKAGASADICESIYAGEKPSSEPETRAIQDFLLSKQSHWISFVSIHSYGGLWLHHWERYNPSLGRAGFLKLCHKPTYALKSINKRAEHKYRFGVPNQLLSYDAAGASDTWAMMVAKIPYSYTLEVGPHEQETYNDPDLIVGFHVHERKIDLIVQRAYAGLKEYMRSFVRRMAKTDQLAVDKTCADLYIELKKLNGYWGNGVTVQNENIFARQKSQKQR